MPRFTKQMMQEIGQNADNYLNDKNFNLDFALKEVNKDAGKMVTKANFLKGYSLAIALCRKDNDSNVDTKLLQALRLSYGVDLIQFYKVIPFYDNLDDVYLDDLDEFYCVDADDKELEEVEEPKSKSKNSVEEKIKIDDEQNEFPNLLNKKGQDNKLSFKETIKKAYRQTSNTAMKDFVLIDGDFINSLINDGAIETYTNKQAEDGEKSIDEELREEYDNNIINGSDDKEVKEQKASSLISNYLTLRQRGEKRSFLDVLRHPIDTFREWKLKNEIKGYIKDQFGLSNSSLDNINYMVCVDKKVDEDFVAFDKNGNEVYESDSKEVKEGFFEDFDLKYEDYNKNAIGAIRDAMKENYAKTHGKAYDLSRLAKDTSYDMDDDVKSKSYDSESEMDDLDRSMDSSM